MNVTAERTVRDVARENPAAPRVFEKFGIDYCCQGDRPLSEACRTANLAIDSVLDALEMAELAAQSRENSAIGPTKTLTDLIWHIQNTHHKYTRDELARIAPLLDKVCGVHGKNHPEPLDDPADISSAIAGIDYSFNERRDDFVPLRHPDGRIDNRQRAGRACAVRNCRKPDIHDGSGTRQRWKCVAGHAAGE